MTPFLRLSLSLTLTMAVWGPNAIDELSNGSIDLAGLAFRFVVTFAFSRLGVWGLGYLFDSYRRSNPPRGVQSSMNSAQGSTPPAAALSGVGRRQTDDRIVDATDVERRGQPSVG